MKNSRKGSGRSPTRSKSSRSRTTKKKPDIPLVRIFEPCPVWEGEEQIRKERKRRRLIATACVVDPKYTLPAVYGMAKRDVVFFTQNFVVAFEPRLNAYVPFVPWEQQIQYLRRLEQLHEEPTQILVEKSRDVGVTYMNVIFAVHRWLFHPGFKSTFCANLERMVDTLGNPDTIFEKARIILRNLPGWILPAGFDTSKHALSCRIINPVNGNLITGESGDNAGRGGRSTFYFIDEAAHIARAHLVNAATSANAAARIWCSSVNGMGNFFASLRFSGQVEVLSLHWREDPRKSDEWAAAKRREIGDVDFAKEYDIDYGASVEGLIILKRWLDAALRLRDVWREKKGGDVPSTEPSMAGLDVGGGKDLSVFVPRHGIVVGQPVSRRDPDTTGTAYWAIELARKHGIRTINFDPIGVGQGVLSAFRHMDQRHIATLPVNVGDQPSQHVTWDDGRTSRERFANLKAELWWSVRDRLKATYELVQFLETDGREGHEWPIEECICLPNDHQLLTQLNIPRWFTTSSGRIIVESKEQLARRGIKSPDHADALVLAMYDARATWGEDGIIVADNDAEQPDW